MHIFKLFETYVYILSWYLFQKIAVGLHTASEPGAGTPSHVPVHGGEYHQAGLDAIIGMSLKFAHQHKIWPRFMAKNELLKNSLKMCPTDYAPCF